MVIVTLLILLIALLTKSRDPPRSICVRRLGLGLVRVFIFIVLSALPFASKLFRLVRLGITVVLVMVEDEEDDVANACALWLWNFQLARPSTKFKIIGAFVGWAQSG